MIKQLFQFSILACFLGIVDTLKNLCQYGCKAFADFLAFSPNFSPIYEPADEVNNINYALGVLNNSCWWSTDRGPQIASNRVEQLLKHVFTIKDRQFLLEPSSYTYKSNNRCNLSIVASSQPFCNFGDTLGEFFTEFNSTNNRIGFKVGQ